MFKLNKVGADVETFLMDEKKRPVPAVGRIGGTKREPRPIDDMGSALQEDNVMLEFNVIPAETAQAFRDNINKVLNHIARELSEQNLFVDISASKRFKAQDLASEQAMTMGCDPDFSAWELQQNELLSPEVLKNIRTSGGHVHVSFTVNNETPTKTHKVNFIRIMDLMLGVPSVILDRDDLRRKFYGRAGAFRFKGPSHIEYRTLSNFWIRNNNLKEWVFNQVVNGVRYLNGNGYHDTRSKELLFSNDSSIPQNILHCIANSDISLAKRIIKEHKVPMPV